MASVFGPTTMLIDLIRPTQNLYIRKYDLFLAIANTSLVMTTKATSEKQTLHIKRRRLTPDMIYSHIIVADILYSLYVK